MTDTAVETPVDGAGSDGITVTSNAEYWQQFQPQQDATAEPPSEDVKQAEAAKTEPEEFGEGEAEEGSESSAEEDDEQEHPQKPEKGKRDGINRRFSELTRERNQERLARQQLEAQLAQAMELVDRVTQGKRPELEVKSKRRELPPDAPQIADYYNDDGSFDAVNYQADMVDFRVEQRLRERDAQAAQAWRQAESARVQQEVAAREAEFRKANPDYEEVIPVATSHPLFQTVVGQEIAADPDGPALAYYLGQHPDELDAMARMTPAQALRHVGKISARIEAERAKPEAPAKKEVSKAPEPIKPVSVASASTDRGYLGNDKLSQAEWERRRNADLKAQGKRL